MVHSFLRLGFRNVVQHIFSLSNSHSNFSCAPFVWHQLFDTKIKSVSIKLCQGWLKILCGARRFSQLKLVPLFKPPSRRPQQNQEWRYSLFHICVSSRYVLFSANLSNFSKSQISRPQIKIVSPPLPQFLTDHFVLSKCDSHIDILRQKHTRWRTSEERVDLKCDNAWGHKLNGDGWMYGK